MIIKIYNILINIFACLTGVLTASFVIALGEAESAEYWNREVLALYAAGGAFLCAEMITYIKEWKKEKEEIREEVEE